MSSSAVGQASSTTVGRVPRRQLAAYPEPGARRFYLALVVAITVALYYALCIGGGVATLVMRELHIPFGYFVMILAVSNLLGGFASLLAGLSDRLGRANLVVWGLATVGLLTLFVTPSAHTRLEWATWTVVAGFVEGTILVATPALIRDFSPQVDRATAMGFWTVGPVLGSLLVSAIVSTTLSVLPTWQRQYEVCGAVCLVMFVVAWRWLKELPPEIRDQLMVTEQDRKLVEARARKLNVEAALRHPWKQVLHADILFSALGVSTLLIFYYTTVGFGVIFSVTMFGFSVERANALANWGWIANAVALIASGLASDRLRVRKPFMLLGGVGALVTTAWFTALVGTHPRFDELALIIALQAGFTGCAYAAWMASFTETVEARNPALTATGLSVWALILRMVVTLSFVMLPIVVNTMTPMIEAPVYLEAMKAAAASHVRPDPVVITHLLALRDAAAAAPGQWRTWYLVCCAGIVLFLVLIPFMKGRWSPTAARRDGEEHARLVSQELRRMESAGD